MTANRSSSLRSFKELSVQAQTLLFIFASAAWARYRAELPDSTILLTELDAFWGAQQLDVDASICPTQRADV
jgi:hypothetical protein